MTAVPQRRQKQADIMKTEDFSEEQIENNFAHQKHREKVVKILDFKLKRKPETQLTENETEYNSLKLLLRLKFPWERQSFTAFCLSSGFL